MLWAPRTFRCSERGALFAQAKRLCSRRTKTAVGVCGSGCWLQLCRAAARMAELGKSAFARVALAAVVKQANAAVRAKVGHAIF